jgi:hypothetical protein
VGKIPRSWTVWGFICGWTILFYQNLPFIPGIFSLITIFAGLGLKIRGFLYVCTATFFIDWMKLEHFFCGVLLFTLIYTANGS